MTRRKTDRKRKPAERERERERDRGTLGELLQRVANTCARHSSRAWFCTNVFRPGSRFFRFQLLLGHFVIAQHVFNLELKIRGY